MPAVIVTGSGGLIGSEAVACFTEAVQKYGRYFGMPTVCFRDGCLTGPNHAGARLHGFLSYLMRCTVTGEHYTVYGYGGKQVRGNIHSVDLVRVGDHRWWISDLSEFRRDYADWKLTRGIDDTLREIYEQNVDAWAVTA